MATPRRSKRFSYSGPASALSTAGRTEIAFFKMLNAQGGINGRTIEFTSVDDGYSPPRTVEETRRLVEAEGVAFLFNGLGTPTQTAVRHYLNAKKVPQLFISSGADKWGDPEHFPWTMGWQPSYRTEAQIYASYMQQAAPGAKLAILYQNDDFGKDYLIGVRNALGLGLHDLQIPVLLPGIKVSTSPTNYHPIRQMQLARWTGASWQLFGRVLL